MKVATLTLNPAIDQLLHVPGFRAGEVHRVERVAASAGGKGVNVASVLAELGVAVVATGFLGRDNAGLFEEHFRARGIEDRFVRLAGATRTNLKILSGAETTDLNLPGLSPAPAELAELARVVDELAAGCDWLVLSGSLPPGMAAEVVRSLVEAIHARGGKVALDTSGPALRLALPARPDLVKPNAAELGEALGRPLAGRDDVAAAARELVARGLPRVVVSLGGEGAVAADAERTLLARPPPVEVVSTVGAGDAMVGGLVAALARGETLAAGLRLGTALGASAVTQRAAGVVVREQVAALEPRVVVEEI